MKVEVKKTLHVELDEHEALVLYNLLTQLLIGPTDDHISSLRFAPADELYQKLRDFTS